MWDWWRVFWRNHGRRSLWFCVHAGLPESFHLRDTRRGEAISYLERQGFTVVHIDDENRVILFRKIQK